MAKTKLDSQNRSSAAAVDWFNDSSRYPFPNLPMERAGAAHRNQISAAMIFARPDFVNVQRITHRRTSG
jgi:hypothetical protein